MRPIVLDDRVNFFNTKREVPAATLIPVKTRRRLFRKYVALFVGVVCLALLSNDLIELRFLISRLHQLQHTPSTRAGVGGGEQDRPVCQGH